MPRRVHVDLSDEALATLLRSERWMRPCWPLSQSLNLVAVKRIESLMATRIVFEHSGLPDVDEEDGRPAAVDWLVKQD